MPRPLLRLVAVSLAASCALAPLPAAAKPAEVEHPAIRAWPIGHFRIGSDETRFGPLEFVGGLEMSSSDWDFGALSAFRFLEAGTRFVGVADTGFWFFGTVARDETGRPVGFDDFTMQQMVDEKGDIIGEKWNTDAEGLAVRDGVATVGFEREHRVSEFRLTPEDMKAPLRDLDFLVPAHELRRNRGFETIAFAHPHGIHEGARVVVSEKSLDRRGNIFAAIIEGPAKGVFTVARRGEFDITDGAFLPGGDLLLLERSYSVGKGVGMRLRRIHGESIMPGALADGPILMEADMGYQIDNMEGMDVWRRGDGALMVSVVSDDNHSLLQRNLYLEFVLHEE
ncbi:esterase-like activity of phytase family protein [Aquibium oceanicum]|uniref:esterase-like activity of phytase family protein n=1 Tax=Aquibium oceanicum TaxID=1670800 RepID=UPI001F383A0D|nr:esterase-like activity of phytase family protein [Aquibium oceanicum]